MNHTLVFAKSNALAKVIVYKSCDELSVLHTAGSDTIFVQIYMDPPPEVPGVSKDAPGSTKHAI